MPIPSVVLAALTAGALAVAAPLLLEAGPAPPSVQGPTPSAPSAPSAPVESVRPVAPVTAHQGARPRWAWPLDPRPVVRRPFVPATTAWGPGHRGLDLDTTVGAQVLAVEGGVVTHAARLAGRGTVTVTHDDGLASTYEPVTAAVHAGDRVRVGQVIGVVEAAGGHCGTAACLHLGAVERDGYRDPEPLLRGGRVRLLPLGRS